MEIIPDKIIRSKRRSIALIVMRDASLVVRVPLRTSMDYVRTVIHEKRLWIQKRQDAARDSCARERPLECKDGEEFLYLGRTYRLELQDGRTGPVIEGDSLKIPGGEKDQIKKTLLLWYKNAALSIITDRAVLYSTVAGIDFKSVRINSAARRWGSCSASGCLNFSWRLIMAPLEAVDYVVVHELSHVLEKNHSRRFWDAVQRQYPAYKVQKRWLRENGERINAVSAAFL